MIALGCSASAETESEADTSAIESSDLKEGLYFTESGNTERDRIEGIRIIRGGTANMLYSYRGSDGRITSSCRARVAVTGSGQSKKLELTCPADREPKVYSIVRNAGAVLELANDRGERFTMERVEDDYRGETRLRCDSDRLSVQIDVDDRDRGRRALLRITLKSGRETMGTPRPETLWVRGEGKLEGYDVHRDEYSLQLPDRLEGRIRAKLGYVNTLTPFEAMEVFSDLECTVDR